MDFPLRPRLVKTVKLDKLTKQIRRDLTANPKKAAALGLMILVALYLWGPMVWGWAVSAKSSKRNFAGDLILEDDPVDPVQTAEKAKFVFKWDKVRQQILGNELMVSAVRDPAWPDPFQGTAPPPPRIATSEQPTPTNPPPEVQNVTPVDLGLALTSVVISPRWRAATISGEVYLENEFIKSPPDQPAGTMELKVTRITRDGVELESDGKTFVLRLERPKLAHGDEIIRDP